MSQAAPEAGKIAYVMSRFPHLPETFILREMTELEQLGWGIELYPLIIQKQTVVHEEARPWLSRLQATPALRSQRGGGASGRNRARPADNGGGLEPGAVGKPHAP